MNMVPYKDFTSAAEILANAKATRAKFFAPARPKPVAKLSSEQMAERERKKPGFVLKPLWACMPTEFNSHVIAFRRWQLMSEEQRGRSEECPEGLMPIMDIVMEVVRKFPGVTIKEIRGNSRMSVVVRPRQIAMWELRQRRPDLSFPAIGRWFSGRDHTTVLHAVRKIEQVKAEGKLDWYFNTRDTE